MNSSPQPSYPFFNMELPATLGRWVPIATVAVTTFVFDFLFWERSAGINVTLFTFWSTVFLVMRYGWKGLSTPAKFALFGALISAVTVYVHDSSIALVASIFSLSVAVAFAHEPQLRSVLYALPQSITSFVMAPLAAWQGWDGLDDEQSAKGSKWAWFRVALIPLLIGVLFLQLYKAGNPKFNQLTAGFLDEFYDLLAEFFTPHIFFLLLAMVVSAVIMRRIAPRSLSNSESRWTDVLLRKRKTRPHWLAPASMGPLERERKAGLVLLVIMNAMLLVVNVIDIDWFWFGFTVPENFSLKQFVHSGTWMLIISILLSIIILLHLFRGNLNFYKRSGSMRVLGIAWIVQNFILGISVFLRNYHYISFHGLAYKRIGVIVFLLLVLVGLVTLFLKVRDRKSFFYLARLNTWALFITLVGLACVDWDTFIVRHNLHHQNKGEIDIDNYLHMSDKVLPLLYVNLDVIEAQMAQHSKNEVRWVYHLNPVEFRRELDVKYRAFQDRYAGQHWQESSLADDDTAFQMRKLALWTDKQ